MPLVLCDYPNVLFEGHSSMNDQHDLSLVLKSHFPLVVIETMEERRALEVLKSVTSDLDKILHTWTVTDGSERALS